MNLKKRNLLSLFLILIMVVTLTGCGSSNKGVNQPTEKKTEEIKTEETKTQDTIALPKTDRAGNEIVVPEEIQSIVSLSPSITEILLEMGVADKIAAIDKNSSGREGIGGDVMVFDMMNPDIEKLANLNPDIVFTGSLNTLNNGENTFQALIDLGICVAALPTSESIAAIEEDIDFVGQVLQDTKKSGQIVETMRDEINKIEEIGKTITDKKTVYFEISAAPDMYSFGSGVFLNELIELIGAKNVFAEESGWMPVEAESLISKNPDIILTSVNYIDNPCEEILAREGLQEVTAVKEKNVYSIDNNSSSLPNQNIVKALKEMAKAVYPDRY